MDLPVRSFLCALIAYANVASVSGQDVVNDPQLLGTTMVLFPPCFHTCANLFITNF